MTEMTASVVSGSLAAFLPSVGEQDREDVLLANLYAQRITREAHAQGLVQDWFGYYKNTLKFLGWDATPPPGVVVPGPSRERLMDDALGRIGLVGSPEQAQVTARALQALNGEALELFEHSARQQKTVNFQLLPCVRHAGNTIDMVLYHQTLAVAEGTTGFLFARRSSAVKVVTENIELVRFNTRLFRAGKRQIVMDKVSAQDRRKLLSLVL